VRAEKKEKVYLEIDAHFDRPSRGGRGRGDRGRGRDDRGRGRDRGTRGRRGSNGTPATVVNVDDETAFPSLS
jgi:plasminogen activator inhibitor 1 RNA-binding protein